MITVKVEGQRLARSLVGSLICKALRDAGLKVAGWSDCPLKEVAITQRDARAQHSEVVLLEIRERK